MEYFALTLAKV